METLSETVCVPFEISDDGAVNKFKTLVQYEHTFVKALGISSVGDCGASLFKESKKNDGSGRGIF